MTPPRRSARVSELNQRATSAEKAADHKSKSKCLPRKVIKTKKSQTTADHVSDDVTTANRAIRSAISSNNLAKRKNAHPSNASASSANPRVSGEWMSIINSAPVLLPAADHAPDPPMNVVTMQDSVQEISPPESACPISIPVALVVVEKVSSGSQPEAGILRPEIPDILATISTKIAAPLVGTASRRVRLLAGKPVASRPMTRTLTGTKTGKVTTPKVSKKTKAAQPPPIPFSVIVSPSVLAAESAERALNTSPTDAVTKVDTVAIDILQKPSPKHSSGMGSTDILTEERYSRPELEPSSGQDDLAIVRVEKYSGEAAKSMQQAMANQAFSQSQQESAGLFQSASVPKSARTPSGTGRKSTSKTTKAVPEAVVEIITIEPNTPPPPLASPIVEVVKDEVVEPEVPSVPSASDVAEVAAAAPIPEPETAVDVLPAEPALESSETAATSIVGIHQALLDIKVEPNFFDESMDEVPKKSPAQERLRTVDSDSTLTASETETLETTQQRKKVKSESNSANRGGTPRRDKRNAEISPTSGNGENPPTSDSLRSPTGQPKQKRKDSARKSSSKKSSDATMADSRDLSEHCRDLNKLGYPAGFLHSGTTVERSPRRGSGSRGKIGLKNGPAGPRMPYSYIENDADNEKDYHTSSEYTNWMSARLRRNIEDPPLQMRQELAQETADEHEKHRQRFRSVSMASDFVHDAGTPTLSASGSGVLPIMMDDMENKPVKVHPRKRGAAHEGKKIGQEPLTDLGRWKPQDDMLLIMAVTDYRDLALVQRQVKFSCHFTLHEVQERWFNLLYNRKVSKSAGQAMRSSPHDIMSEIQRKTPFSEAEETLLAEIPVLNERPTRDVFAIVLESNRHIFPAFRTADDLEKHWKVMLSDGRLENSDTLLVVPDDQLNYNGERILPFCEMESKIKDSELKDWKHVSGEFAYEMARIQRQNRFNIMRLDKEMEHLRFLLEKSLNYELPDFTRPEFASAQDRSFLAVLLGQRAKYGIKTGKVTFGRSVPGKTVDLDFSFENYAGKLSRLQGYIVLERNGNFRIENHGRRPVFVDEHILHHGDFAPLSDEATVEVGDIRLQFFVNRTRVQRFLRQKYYGEWLSDDEPEDTDKEKKSSKNSKKAAKSRKNAASDTPPEPILASNQPASSKKIRSKKTPVRVEAAEEAPHINGGYPSQSIARSNSLQESGSRTELDNSMSGQYLQTNAGWSVGQQQLAFPSGVIVSPAMTRLSNPYAGSPLRSASAPDTRSPLSSPPRNPHMAMPSGNYRPMPPGPLGYQYQSPQSVAQARMSPSYNSTFVRPIRHLSGQFMPGTPMTPEELHKASQVNGISHGESRPPQEGSLTSTVPNPDTTPDARRTLG